MQSDKYFIEETLKMAKSAQLNNEVPVAAIIVADNKIIGKGQNQVELLQDPTAHAEMIAITAACNYIGSKYLTNATLYVNLEPCGMCKTAIAHAQIKRVVYAAKDTSNINSTTEFCHYAEVLVQQEASTMITQFFKKKRRKQ